ncbi:threonine transporter (plasmid) [Mycolicibacterium arabiense]|uniref:Threonine transporter n=1 Tax=Mycolicibacterium arabiense TaxID=1286181 RepID=A0A7I7RQH8_9MYCO|nr:LysE family transporter [Mycolicibacterium arabiense]MCV7372165.1 LysE family transporter [Mycolicibacterium arabiense]BBY46814.1 threonine transporter [Mycolicibacterium arabiense]
MANQDIVSLVTIAGAVAIGAISPGPSFLLVAQTALSTTPRRGRVATLGVGTGGLVFAVAATAGVGTVLAYAVSTFLVIKVLAGDYLMYLGVRLWKAGDHDGTLPQAGPLPSSRTFAIAMSTQLSNPKATVVHGSVFASALPAHPSRWLLTALPLVVLSIEASWYLTVATMMSRPTPRLVYGRARSALDHKAGTFMAGLGALIATEGLRGALR